MPDIALVDSADFQFFQHTQPFADLTDEIEGLEDYLPEALAPCEEEGRIKGLPFGVNCVALFYNEEMLAKRGLNPPAGILRYGKGADSRWSLWVCPAGSGE